MKSSSGLFWCGVAAIIVLTAVVYCGVFRNELVDFDDNIYITQNPHTQSGFSPAGFRYAWTTFDSGNWIPLTWLSYQLDTTLLGFHPASYHATNLALHILNVLLLFVWLRRTTAATGKSFVAAALFAVHPLHVESVAWAAERKDVLSTFWLLIALLTYQRYVVRLNPFWYLATLTAFAAGLLAKSMVVTLPLLLLIVDFWPLERFHLPRWTDGKHQTYPLRTLRWLILEKSPLFALSLADGLITMAAQHAGHIVGSQTVGTAFSSLSPWTRAGNAVIGYGWYLEKTCWPTGLCVFYLHPGDRLSPGSVLISGLALATMTMLVLMFGRHRRALIAGWLWYLISLLPVIGLIQVGSQAYADRYSYLPQVGLLVLTVWLVSEVLDHFRISLSARAAVAALTIAVLGWLTLNQVAVWRSTDTLWARALEVDPDNWFAHLQVGNHRAIQGLSDDLTLRHLMIVYDQNPRHPVALNNLGWIQQQRGDWDAAVKFYRQSLAADPRYSPSMHNLILALKKQGQLAQETARIEQYLKRRPDDAWTINELGMIAVRQGQMERGRDLFQQSLEADPDQRAARVNLALALVQLGYDQEARTQLETVLKKYPDDADAHMNLGLLLDRLGQPDEARRQYAEVVRINPDDREAQERLGKRLPTSVPSPP